MLFAIHAHLYFYDFCEPPRLLKIFLVCPSEFLAQHHSEHFIGYATFASLSEYGVVVLYLAKKSLGSNASLVTSLIALITAR